MKVLRVEPYKPPYEKEIDSGLESLQSEVGGWIQAVYTQLGFHSIKLEKETTLNGVKYPCTEYSWQSKSGMFIYKAIVVGGRVWSVEDIAAELSGSRRQSSTSDPYNASDYAHVDDFYYDHRDDFFDFEEAEDYYDKHN